MSILGTQIGDPTIPGTPGASVSDYAKYYGTYSGADIKVIVHYPRDPTVEKALEKAKQTVEIELAAEETAFFANRDLLSTSEFVAAVERLDALRAELAKLDSQVANTQNLPSSKVLGEITSFSWSVYRDKQALWSLGAVYPRSYTRGPRTIAGTMVFTIFHQHVFHELASLRLGYYSTGSSDFDKYKYTTVLSDQLPPLDISLVFANEYGALSHMGLWGVEFFQEGGTFSIEDIYSENILQYVARDIDPMRLTEQRKIDGEGVSREWNQTASDMLYEKQLSNHLIRRDSFI